MKLFSHHLPLSLNALGCIIGALALTIAIAPFVLAGKFADIVFIVDESSSMSGEHGWLRQTIGDLEAALQAKAIGRKPKKNRYGLVGFGNGPSSYLGHSIPVGNRLFGSAAQFADATNSLVTRGGFEDGYSAIHYALNNYSFRQGAAVHFILITDEDRDNGNSALNFDNTLNALQDKNALLNVIVNHRMTGNHGQQALGSDANRNAFFADGNGGFTTAESGLMASSSFGTTKQDYVDLAWATGNSTLSGTAWDLNLLRSGGTTAQSFSAAFVESKATEILKQTQILKPSTTLGFLELVAFGVGQCLHPQLV